ncbi:hypothetical protein DOY81_010873, partial [Sarcophaga bullata]
MVTRDERIRLIDVPPSVRATPTSGNLQARKGGPVTLECKALRQSSALNILDEK